MKSLVLALLLLLAIPSYGMAVTTEYDGNQANIHLAYTEPSVNADPESTPLTDLKRCYGTIDLVGDGQAAQTWSIDASSASGGVLQSFSATFDLTHAQAESVSGIEGRAQCEDLTLPPNVSAINVLNEALTFTFPVVPDTTSPDAPIFSVTVVVTVTQRTP